MANTREQLKRIGAESVNDEALVQAGMRTIRGAVQETLKAKGITEANFDLVLKNGERISITSDTNPALDRPAEEVSSMSVKQSAKAGGLDWEIETIFTVR